MSKKPQRLDSVVNHPPHYRSATGMEAIDVIEGFDLGFRLGNSVEYILRAGKKASGLDPLSTLPAKVQDLKKAQWYVTREIAAAERALKGWQQIERKVVRQSRSPRKRRRR